MQFAVQLQLLHMATGRGGYRALQCPGVRTARFFQPLVLLVDHQRSHRLHRVFLSVPSCCWEGMGGNLIREAEWLIELNSRQMTLLTRLTNTPVFRQQDRLS